MGHLFRIWAGDGGEGAKYGLSLLTELKNRGVADVRIVVCDGLKCLPDAITTTWPLASVQTCVIHLLGNTLRCAGRHDWDAIAKDLRPVYTAVNGGRRRGPAGGVRRPVGRQVRGEAVAVRLDREHRRSLDYDVSIRRSAPPPTRSRP